MGNPGMPVTFQMPHTRKKNNSGLIEAVMKTTSWWLFHQPHLKTMRNVQLERISPVKSGVKIKNVSNPPP